MMGGVSARASVRTVGMWLHAAARPEQRPETIGVMGGSTPDTFALTGPWIQE